MLLIVTFTNKALSRSIIQTFSPAKELFFKIHYYLHTDNKSLKRKHPNRTAIFFLFQPKVSAHGKLTLS